MNPLIRYILLFIVWFGVVLGYYQKTTTTQSEQVIKIKESPSQDMTIKLLENEVNTLERKINTQKSMLAEAESKVDALEKKKAKLAHAHRISKDKDHKKRKRQQSP